MITLKTFDRTPHLAELKVSDRRGRPKGSRREVPPWVVTTPVRAEEYLRAVWDKDTIELREEFVVLCLDSSNTVLGWVRLHTGSLDSSPVDPRLVFAVALQTASTAIVVAHNHPSGSVEPSEHDVELTRRLTRGAKLVGVRLLDHLILSRTEHYSFAAEGLLEAG